MHLFFVRARSFSAEVGRYVQDGLLTAVAPFARLSAASGVAEKVLRRARERAGLQPRRKARPNTFNNLWPPNAFFRSPFGRSTQPASPVGIRQLSETATHDEEKSGEFSRLLLGCRLRPKVRAANFGRSEHILF